MISDDVAQILASAETAGGFQLRDDRVFKQNDAYPALVVLDRGGSFDELSNDHTDGVGGLRYKVAVLMERDGGSFDQLENLVRTWLRQLVDDDCEFRLVDLQMYEAAIAGREVLAAIVVLAKDTTYDL